MVARVGDIDGTHKYIKCCDDDTWPEENHLEKVRQFMENNDLDFTWCYRRMWKRTGELIGIDKFKPPVRRTNLGTPCSITAVCFTTKKLETFCSKSFNKNRSTVTTGTPQSRYTPTARVNEWTRFLRTTRVTHLEHFFVNNCET